jgi:predicted phosphoribosyltransferase
VPFADRVDAGRQLAGLLSDFRDEDVVVLGLPRGGVVVAAQVARALAAPLDVIIVRKLGVPFQTELAMGAIGEDIGGAIGGAIGAESVVILNPEVGQRAGVTPEEMAEVARRERAELARRARTFRGDRPPLSLAGRTALIVDDGVATGSTARAACQVARGRGAARVVVAVPVGPPDVAQLLAGVADEVRCLQMPGWLGAIGQFYGDFSQTGDEEVVALLRDQPSPPGAPTRQ